jgi:hypothetical protein
MRRYVVVIQTDDGASFCNGIYDDYRIALGVLMDSIFDVWENYDEDKGDYFKIGKPYEMDGEGGECINISYRSACSDRECMECYMILYVD